MSYDINQDPMAMFMDPKTKAKIAAKQEKIRLERDKFSGAMLTSERPSSKAAVNFAEGKYGKRNKRNRMIHKMVLNSARKADDAILARFSQQH